MLRLIAIKGFKVPHRGFSNSVQPSTQCCIDTAGIATVTLQRSPVNSINLDVIQELNKIIVDLSQNKDCKGIIFTSALSSVFSAGLDFKEIYKPCKRRFGTFYGSLQEMAINTYSISVPTVTVINGHMAAGGSLLAILADYRVAVEGNFKLTMNDSVIGIEPSTWIKQIMTRVLGAKNAERVLLDSTVYTPKEALKIGLVDELVSTKEEGLETSKKYIYVSKNVPLDVRGNIKRSMREETLTWLKNNMDADRDKMVECVTSSETQAALKRYLQQMKNYL